MNAYDSLLEARDQAIAYKQSIRKLIDAWRANSVDGIVPPWLTKILADAEKGVAELDFTRNRVKAHREEFSNVT